jgi:hypothetical protein
MGKKRKPLNPIVKNILSALAVAFFGFILLNLTFLLDFGFQSALNRIVGLFVRGVNMDMAWGAYPPLKHLLFCILICLLSWIVFRSKLGTLYKATYMTVPLAVVFATIGIFLYRWPILPYLVGLVFSGAVLYYLRRTRQPWIYYYALILVGLVLAIFSLSGGEI